ncbi:hypothetical protein ACIQPR_09935 [Streptomyces sp. NPDC091280]|uniref:hypothetical protein n=1 Tax=Streptomyces sp. NPDC091280 TaxID=3365984 RepID=UPI0037FB836D
MDRLHTLVSSTLGDHPALARVRTEAASDEGEPSGPARQLLAAALANAVASDHSFADRLDTLIEEIRGAENPAAGGTTITMSGTFHGQTVGQGTINVTSADLSDTPDPGSQRKPQP